MRNICILLLVGLPFLSWSQNLEFKVGGSVSINSPFLNDLINPEDNNITRDVLLTPEYGWLFDFFLINNIFSQYREVEPGIGGNIYGIGKLQLDSSLFLRTGVELQYIAFNRIVNRKLASYNTIDNYDWTLVLHDVNYETPMDIFYLTLPLGLEYKLKNKKLSIFGDLLFSARLGDFNKDFSDESARIAFDAQGIIATPPIMEQFLLSAKVGATYQLNEKLDIDFSVLRSFSNMFAFSTLESQTPSFIGPDELMPKLTAQKSLLQQVSLGISYKLF